MNFVRQFVIYLNGDGKWAIRVRIKTVAGEYKLICFITYTLHEFVYLYLLSLHDSSYIGPYIFGTFNLDFLKDNFNKI